MSYLVHETFLLVFLPCFKGSLVKQVPASIISCVPLVLFKDMAAALSKFPVFMPVCFQGDP